MNTKTIIAAIVALTMPGIASAQINKCLNSSGKVVAYGAECPPGTRSEQMNIKNTPGASAPAAQKSAAESDADMKKRQIEKQEAGAKAEEKLALEAQRKRACEDSRSYLKSLQTKQRITRTDPKTGEKAFLADSDYPTEITQAERGIAANCK